MEILRINSLILMILLELLLIYIYPEQKETKAKQTLIAIIIAFALPTIYIILN